MKRVWEVRATEGSLGPNIYVSAEWAFHDLDVRMSFWPSARFFVRSYVVPEGCKLP